MGVGTTYTAGEFEDLVRRELNGNATYEDETALWANHQIIQRWFNLLKEMKQSAEGLLEQWEAQFQEEERKFQAARVYKLPDWQRFCEDHAAKVRRYRDMLTRVESRMTRIYEYFNTRQEERLYEQVLHGTPVQVEEALQELHRLQQKRLVFEEKQAAYSENWGYGFKHGMMLSTKYYRELLKLGWSAEDSAKILRRYANTEIQSWIPYARGHDKQELPDFHVWLIDHNYHCGPLGKQDATRQEETTDSN